MFHPLELAQLEQALQPLAMASPFRSTRPHSTFVSYNPSVYPRPFSQPGNRTREPALLLHMHLQQTVADECRVENGEAVASPSVARLIP